jgi:hypothetical protein
MINSDLDDNYYGNWINRIEDWRLKNTDLHQSYIDRLEKERVEEERRQKGRQQTVHDIVQTLDAQAQSQKATTQARRESEVNGNNVVEDAQAQSQKVTTQARRENEENGNNVVEDGNQTKGEQGIKKSRRKQQNKQAKENEESQASEEDPASSLSMLDFDKIKKYVEQRGREDQNRMEESEEGRGEKRKTRSTTANSKK